MKWIKHIYEGDFDKERDIIVINPGDNEIDMDDIRNAFYEMQEQFEILVEVIFGWYNRNW